MGNEEKQIEFGQPAPIPNDKPALWPMVIEDFRSKFISEFVPRENPLACKIVSDMRSRDEFGRNKYGVSLQANNGRNPLQDAYEELLDAAVYLKQSLVEEQSANPDRSRWVSKREKIIFDVYERTISSLFDFVRLLDKPQ